MGTRLVEILSRPGLWVVSLGVAAFIALFWAIRGAPPGQSLVDPDETADAPPAGARDRALALGLAGLVLVGFGAYLAPTAGIPWSIPAFVAGYGLCFGVIRRQHRHRHESPTIRRMIGFLDAAATASLIAGVIVVGNVLAFRYGDRPIDLTRERIYSLESLTIGQLKSLKKPLRFTVFGGESPRALRQADRVLQLLDLYRSASQGRVVIDVLHAYADPVKFDEMVRRVPDVAVAPGGGVVLEYGDGDVVDRAVVRNSQMFDEAGSPLASSGQPDVRTVFRGEDAITSALVRIRELKRPKILFLAGHGEPSVHELDRSRQGIGVLRARLEALGAEVAVHNPAREPLPTDATLAIVAGPSAPFQADAADRLKEYARGGGRLLIFLDGRKPTGLEAWLADSYRIEVGRSTLRDPQYRVRGNAAWLLAPIVGDSHHPIVESLFNRMAEMPFASPLKVLPAPPNRSRPDDRTIEVILRSSNAAWGEVDPDRPHGEPEKGDLRGPLPLAVAVADLPPIGAGAGGEETPRLVVFGSPLAADNRVLAGDPTNMDLVVNAVNWLRGRSELSGISSRTHVALKLTADLGLRRRLILLPTLLAFGVIAALAASTYLARRA